MMGERRLLKTQQALAYRTELHGSGRLMQVFRPFWLLPSGNREREISEPMSSLQVGGTDCISLLYMSWKNSLPQKNALIYW